MLNLHTTEIGAASNLLELLLPELVLPNPAAMQPGAGGQLHLAPKGTQSTVAAVCVIPEVQDPELEILKTLEVMP